MSGLAERLRPLLESDTPPPPAELVANIATIIEDYTQRDGFDLKRIALLGWAESQRDDKLKQAMIAFYAAFIAQLAGCISRWKTSGLVDVSTDADHMAKALLALLVGYVVQAAVVGGMNPAILKQGVEDLIAYGGR